MCATDLGSLLRWMCMTIGLRVTGSKGPKTCYIEQTPAVSFPVTNCNSEIFQELDIQTACH